MFFFLFFFFKAHIALFSQARANFASLRENAQTILVIDAASTIFLDSHIGWMFDFFF